MTLGRECAGTVMAHSSPASADSPPIGAKVACLAGDSYAEYTAANISHAYTLPESFQDTRLMAAGLLQGLTAVTLIREAHPVKAGEWVLVHAAAGGMGLWLCQLLKAVGARTIATASTPEKRETARKAGAEVLLEYPEQMEGGFDAFVKKVHDITDDKGVGAVFDGVGKATFDVSLACVARKGTLASFGNASGAVPPLTISRLAGKNVKLCRPMLYGYVSTKEEFDGYTKELVELIRNGKVDVAIHKEYTLDEVQQAHKDLEGRNTQGKLIFKA